MRACLPAPPPSPLGEPLLLLPFLHFPLINVVLHCAVKLAAGRDPMNHHVFPILQDATTPCLAVQVQCRREGGGMQVQGGTSTLCLAVQVQWGAGGGGSAHSGGTWVCAPSVHACVKGCECLSVCVCLCLCLCVSVCGGGVSVPATSAYLIGPPHPSPAPLALQDPVDFVSLMRAESVALGLDVALSSGVCVCVGGGDVGFRVLPPSSQFHTIPCSHPQTT